MFNIHLAHIRTPKLLTQKISTNETQKSKAIRNVFNALLGRRKKKKKKKKMMKRRRRVGGGGGGGGGRE